MFHATRHFTIICIICLLSGCGSLYQVNVSDNNNFIKTRPADLVKSSYVFVGSDYYDHKIACGTNGFYYIESGSANGSGFIKIFGLNRDHKKYYWNSDGNPFKTMARENQLINIVDLKPGVLTGMTCSTENVHLEARFRLTDERSKKFNFDYVDRTSEMVAWRGEYINKKPVELNDYISYTSRFPTNPFSKKLVDEMFGKFFSVKVIASSESAQRSESSGGLLGSYAGSCKDISKTIQITKTTKQEPASSILLKVKYTLTRKYEPYKLSEDGDPLYINKIYTLNSSNSFKVTDPVKFECVMTSGRFHNVAMSFIGKIIGVSGKDTGVNTTLTQSKFSIDITPEFK